MREESEESEENQDALQSEWMVSQPSSKLRLHE